MSSRTEHGGLVELRLEQQGPERVCYALELGSPEGTFVGSAEVSIAEGEVRISVNPAPPDWLLGAARALLRTLWRERRAADASPWPRRLTRWREGPR